jgi:hypothetical protein
MPGLAQLLVIAHVLGQVDKEYVDWFGCARTLTTRPSPKS